MAHPAPAAPQDKFAVEKATHGGVTLLTMHGTLNDAFEGRKIAESVRTKNVVLTMRDVRRFASWGMSEWMDFLRINAERNLYLVECSTYAVSQINLVTGLLGHAKLVSFYASYRCGSCNKELATLFLIPRDRTEIRGLPGSHQECSNCGGRAWLEEYPAAFFDTIADRPEFDIDDDVLAFFRSHFKYDLTPDLTRFRAYRSVRNDYTYIRLSGNLSRLPPDLLVAASQGTTVVDLEGIVFDRADVSQWRAFLRAGLSKVKSLQLLHCPPGFLETGVVPEDLHNKLKVRTFALAYDCLRCETTTAYMVDVAENLEQLVGGTAPTARCTTCRSLLVAALSHEQSTCLRSLPARDRDAVLDKFLAKARTEKVSAMENCLVALPQKPTVASTGTGRAMYVALGLTTLLVAGLALVAWQLWKRNGDPTSVNTAQPILVPPSPPKPTFERPDWVMSDIPSSGYCHDMINRLMCVGVSSYRPTRDEAVGEANDAALEELVNIIGLKISTPFFRQTIMPGYSDVRSKALSALQAADFDRTSAAYVAADDVVTKARRRVVDILQVSGGAAAPAQRSDWYWEEYAAKKGGTEFLVFVRYDVTMDAVKALVEKYSVTTPVMDSTAMTAFPALVWEYPDFTGGALLMKVGRPLAAAGIAQYDVVMVAGEQRVGDVINFARQLEVWKRGTADLKLTVKAPDAPVRVVELRRR